MFETAASAPLLSPPSRARRVMFIAVGVALAVSIAAVVALMATGPAVTALVSLGPTPPFEPRIDDGLIAEGTVATLADEHLPAIARLDPALRDAMRRAEADAAADGVTFEVTSGWRSPAYQQWLLDDAVEFYASDEVARQYVATPEASTHVTGDGIDIGPVDAQFWLISYGARHGICQTYANELWHFELATEPGGVCPEMKTDAAQ